MIELLDNLQMDPSIAVALKKENIVSPTEIQRLVIPEALKNKDLIVQSETGTGKTLAFLIPLFEKLKAVSREMQAIILVPTHELAIQIQRQIELLSQNSEIKLKSTTIIGNVNIERQIDKLREKPNIIVGSPGRIIELIKMKKIILHTIRTIIIDEADRMTDKGNIDDVKAIIKGTLKERQIMMFSASITQETLARAKEMMREPQTIKSKEKTPVPTSIAHHYFVTDQRDKIEILRKLVKSLNPKKAIVFVTKNDEIERITSKLKHHDIKAECLYGANRKLDRKKTMEDFKSGKLQLLVASDIAARGLHIEGITHIFNFNIPEAARDYLHRAGRSGRNGNTGVSISIVTKQEIPLLKMYEKTLKIAISLRDIENGVVIDPKLFKRAKFDHEQNSEKNEKISKEGTKESIQDQGKIQGNKMNKEHGKGMNKEQVEEQDKEQDKEVQKEQAKGLKREISRGDGNSSNAVTLKGSSKESSKRSNKGARVEKSTGLKKIPRTGANTGKNKGKPKRFIKTPGEEPRS